MNLYNLKETSKKTGMSGASIYRFYERNTELWNEQKRD
jgi:predicted DNA-binding transcriptional regulator AlpA